jgi:hypothetical protein
LIIRMQGGEKLSLEQIRALLEASQEVQFAGHSREDIYEWVGTTLREQNYAHQGREAKGLLRSYVAKTHSSVRRKDAPPMPATPVVTHKLSCRSLCLRVPSAIPNFNGKHFPLQ